MSAGLRSRFNSLFGGESRCERCDIEYSPGEYSHSKCLACSYEAVDDGPPAWELHGHSADVARDQRAEGLYICGVTGEATNISEMTVSRVPVYADQVSTPRSMVIPYRVKDDTRVLEWAKRATEIRRQIDTSFGSRPTRSPDRGELRNQENRLRSIRPGYAAGRQFPPQNQTRRVYYGIPKRVRPHPTERLVMYEGEQVPPRSDLVPVVVSELNTHSWGQSSSQKSAAVTAAGILAHAYDEDIAEKHAADVVKAYLKKNIGTTNGVWSLPKSTLDSIVFSAEPKHNIRV